MIPPLSSFPLHPRALSSAVRLIAAAFVLAATPAQAAYLVVGEVFGQICTDAANKATCQPAVAIQEISVGGRPLELTAVPAVTEVEGATCRVRVGPRANAPDPEMQALMTAKYMVDTHDKVEAVAVDVIFFACKQQ